jgi:hypothetical protein
VLNSFRGHLFLSGGFCKLVPTGSNRTWKLSEVIGFSFLKSSLKLKTNSGWLSAIYKLSALAAV